MSDIIPEGFGSTFLSPIINNYADLVYRCKSLLGFPVHSDELTDTQWAMLIDEAIENYTTWGGGSKEEYLIFCSSAYKQGCGVKLDDLISVGCNAQYCNTTTVLSAITSSIISYDLVSTKSAYLSVTPFSYPVPIDISNPYSVAYTAHSGQNIFLYFDPANPWNADNVCQLDCVAINPLNSQWYNLSSNSALSAIRFDFINDSVLAPLASALSGYTSAPLSSVPLTSLNSMLSAIPVSYYDLSAFYPDNILFGPPLEACMEIGAGTGYIYPKCNTRLINACSALSSQYNISPAYDYITTTIDISSVNVAISSVSFSSISSYFALYCQDCNCNCAALSSINYTTSSVDFLLYKNVISGSDGVIWDLSATDISAATHVQFKNVPVCAGGKTIALNNNTGIVSNFTLCNSALSTNGKMYIENVQFLQDYKPDVNLLYNTTCGWNNNGFTLTCNVDAYSGCVSHTPEKIPVDISFYRKNTTTEVGVLTSYYSTNYDYGLNRKRKIYGVFSLDNANNTGSYGGFGSDLLFNFDYALLASTFGYNMQGSRINAGLGYDLVSYHLARSFVEQSKKMLRYISYTWDERTQYLKMTPEPPLYAQDGGGGSCCNSSTMGGYANQCYLIGVYVEAPVQELVSTYFVREYTLARAKQVIGTVRSKFGGVTLYGGATLDGTALIQDGTTRIEALMKELRTDNYYTAPPSFFVQ